MSGVANEDTQNPPKDAKASDAEQTPTQTDQTADQAADEARANHRRAAYLRVVADNETPAPPLPETEDGRPAQRIGAYIRSVRENLGLTLEQVSKDTRITVSHLRAIEEMTPNLIGVPVYVQGHVRTYARHLKLDAEAILQRYRSECALLSDPEKPEITAPSAGRKRTMAVPVLGLLAAVLIGAGAVAYFSGGDSEPAQNPGLTEAPAIVAASGETRPAVAPPLRIVALERGHIEVRSSAGDKFLDREFAPGESYTPRVGAGWTVSVRSGSAFEWRLGDNSLGLVGADGGPVYAQSVDAAALRPPIIVERPPEAVAPAVSTGESEAQAPLTTSASPSAPTSPPPATAPSSQPRASQSANPPASQPAQQPVRQQPAAAAPSTVEAAPAPAPAPTTEIAPLTPQNDTSLQAYPDN